jgi:hypothetical protein
MKLRKKAPDKNNFPDQAAIEAAMRALPLWLPSNVCADYIPTLAEKYVYLGFDRLRAGTPYTKREVESQLSGIRVLSDGLAENLLNLNGMAADAFNSCRPTISPEPLIAALNSYWPTTSPTLGEVQRILRWLSKIASLATPPSTAKTRKGPNRKLHPLEIAKTAARDFHSLTGNAPSRGKRFSGFLGAIFKALDIRHDSVEHFAREASHWWHNERSNEVMESLREAMLKPTRVSEEGFILSKTSEWHK